ncbi:tetratricopeptide repeat protein [Amycolatopsis sp. WGS_07]|uniref:tetratricopeptide repeat protein n=1 Tax=Amycolatopsis sp. WGS_07 TaxID=3076764 RepID=UPI0038739758
MTGTAPGSGYAVASSLVLTSAHVVGPVGTSATVFFLGRQEVHAGVVVWRGTPGGGDDAALVEVDDAVAGRGLSGAVGWGRLVTHRPKVRCECCGVPDLVQRADRAIDVLQLTGSVNPGDRAVGERYVVNLDAHPPSGRAPWGGMSGAAVLCEGLLTGVVAAEPADREHAALEAIPAFVLLREPDFRAIVARHAGAEAAASEAVELHDLADPQARGSSGNALLSPAGLLAPRRAVVPFHGREETLSTLEAWSEEDGLGVWLLHAPGGQGKTRLAHQFGASRVRAGWAVLWLDRDAPKQSLDVLADVRAPTLVVVDYAEGRSEQLAALAEVLVRRRSSVPVKLLLLARTAGAWWRELPSTGEAIRDLVDIAEISALPALDGDNESREQSYQEAVAAFSLAARRIRGAEANIWSAAAAAINARPLRQAWDGTVLAVHMTALADLLDAVTEAAQPMAGVRRGPEDRVLDHERGYWLMAAQASRLLPIVTTAMVDDVVAAATIVGPSSGEELDELLTMIPAVAELPLGLREAVRGWLVSLYPTVDDGKFEGLVPDRLAERLAGRLMLDRSRQCVLETLAVSASEEDARKILTVATRAAAHRAFGSAVSAAVTELCLRHHKLLPAAVDTAPRVEDSTPLLDALARFADDAEAGSPMLDLLTFAFPDDSEVLADVAVAITGAAVQWWRGQTLENAAEEAYLAVLLQRLAGCFGAVGRYYDSLDAITESVDILRRLQKSYPGASPVLLCSALNSLSNDLRDLGRYDEALELLTESVMLQRDSGDIAGLDDFEIRNYATNLNNLGNVLGIVGRYDEAIEAVNEAVEIRRALAGHESSSDLADLALGLNSQSNALAALGRHADALTASIESVEMRRSLVAERPDAYLPNLAASLYNLALRLGDLGRGEQALEAIAEAVGIERRLAERRPAVYEARLAESLHVMSDFHRVLDRLDDGRACLAEAVGIRRRLAEDRRGMHLPDLASSLASLSSISHDLGRLDDELSARFEEVGVRRRLAERDPVHLRSLIPSLVGLSNGLAGQGRTEEALEAIVEAIAACRRLDDLEAKSYSVLLVKLLGNRVNLLHELRRYEEEILAASEAVDILRRLGPDESPARSDELGSRLLLLSEALADAGRLEDAQARAAEAGEVWRTLNDQRKGACTRALAMSLGIRALVLTGLGREQESLAAVTEAVELMRQAKDNGSDEDLPFAEFLYECAVRLAGLGREAEAVAAVTEAIDVEQEAIRKQRKTDTETLDECRRLLARLQSAELS